MRAFLLMLNLTFTIASFAQWHSVKGNNVFKSETREASGYTALAAGGMMQVEIAYGNSQTIKLEGEENLLPYIETTVEDGMLTIKVKERYTLKTNQPIKVYVSMTTITALAQSGSGGITGKGEFSNKGNTSVAVAGLGSVKVNFTTIGSLSMRMSGSGSVNLSGKVENEADIKQSGSGNANLENMSCNEAVVQLSGSGNLRIHVNKALTAQISGSGNIEYSGDATVTSKVAGSGRVRKA